MTNFKRQQQKHVKKPYRVRNWAEYEAGLRNRGSLMVWLEVDGVSRTVRGWNARVPARRKRGRQKKYSNTAIETFKRIGMVCGLPGRQTEGFLGSLFELLDLDLDVPNHSTASRRGRKLGLVDMGSSQSIKPKSPTWRERNRNIRGRERLGKRRWGASSGYNSRCKAETAFSRYKRIIGPAMRARNFAAERVEARIGTQILNKMTALGMPDSYMIG